MPKTSTKPAAPAAAKPEKKASPSKNGKGKPKVEERPIVYPKIEARIYEGDHELTEEQAKQLLGWNEVPDGAEHTLVDINDKKVRLDHNPRNRKFEMQLALMYAQLILEKQWELNGESAIIGKTGWVISFQHRGAGLALACQMWRKEPEKYPKWTTAPTMPCIIVFGVEEIDRVVNTVDTGRPRTFADVIYRSDYFAKEDAATRDNLARSLALAAHLVMERTKARDGSISKKCPHAEGLEFVDSHMKLLRCVKHIKEENGKDNRISAYLAPGRAAGLMYLMGCSSTTLEQVNKYRTQTRDEKTLNFDSLELAENFFTYIGQRHEQFKALYETCNDILATAGRMPPDEAIGHFVKAFLLMSNGDKVTKEGIDLQIEIDHDIGKRVQKEFPAVGGPDFGKPDADETNDPPENVVQERANLEKAKKGQPPVEVGNRVWIPENGDHATGVVKEINGEVVTIMSRSKKTSEYPLDKCLTRDPNA